MREYKGNVVAILVEDISDSETGMPSTALPLGLPGDLAQWVSENQELVTRVQDGLRTSYSELTPEQIWQVIATASGDPGWLKAQQDMQAAENTWKEMNHPLNAPLGAIGRALESDETVSAHERYLSMLANFAIISEGLMERRPDLARLLNVLLVQKRMLDQSLSRARQVLEAAKNLGEMFSLQETFRRAAKPRSISGQFRRAMRRILARKQFNATSVIVPWSQET